MTEDFEFRAQDGQDALYQLAELTEVYSEIYAEPPYNSGPLWAVEAFTDRTSRQAQRAGFAMVTARQPTGQLVGYAFGLPFAEGRWWTGDATPAPQEILDAPKFAVIELLVRKPFRGHGIGRHLLDDLVAPRTETYAILTTMPDAPAREHYRRWGWQQVGTAHHTPESPVLDSLVLPLKP